MPRLKEVVNAYEMPDIVNVQGQSQQSPEQIQNISTKQTINMVSGKNVFDLM